MRRCNSPRFPDCDSPVQIDPSGVMTCLNGHSQVARPSDRKEPTTETDTSKVRRFSNIAAEMGLTELGLFCKLARQHEHVAHAAKSLGKHEMTLRTAVKRASGLGWGDFRKRVLAGEIWGLDGNNSPAVRPAAGTVLPPGHGFIRYRPIKPHLANEMTVGWARHTAGIGKEIAVKIGKRADLFFDPDARTVLIMPGQDLAVVHRGKENRYGITVNGFNKEFGIDWRGQLQAEWDEELGGFVVMLPEEAMKGAKSASE